MKRTLDNNQMISDLMNMDKSTLPPDGGEHFNRLIFARSPYLIQHSGNPVDWYEWSAAAFEKARRENMPIFLSIGYATCHWCHVMAHESFEDKELASLINRYFVCIKVDREERPDIDDFYMSVSQLLTGSGGWPLNIFMTPDRHPFMAITYLPKNKSDNIPGLMDLLTNIAAIWRQRPDLVEKNCNDIMEALGEISSPLMEQNADLADLTRRAQEKLQQMYDTEMGGFGTAPKFPMPIYLSWLIEQGHAGDKTALNSALYTMRRIRNGGIWDQLGGGLHRYAVDQAWLVPHFEKMLYDQALMALVSLEAFQISNVSFFLEMAEEIFSFVEQELTSKEGGFCSALDADSEGVEGRFYVWDRQEIEASLGEDTALFCNYFDVTAAGNFEGHTILNIPVDREEFCQEQDLDPADTERRLKRCRTQLLKQRAKRVRPLRDGKIITAWNGLMIAALAKGGIISGKQIRVEQAAHAATFILKNLRRSDGRLLRSYLDGPSDVPAFLEDYACLAFGLLELFEATLDSSWLAEALRLADESLQLFHSLESGKFFKVGRDVEQMPVRASLDHDGVIPSAFSIAAKCFVRLSHACNRPDLYDFAHILLETPLSDAQRQPTAHLGALQALGMLDNEPTTVRLHGRVDSKQIHKLLQAAKACYVYNMSLTFEESADEGQAFVCACGVCNPPVSDSIALRKILLHQQFQDSHQNH
jgi:uncharacterized protein YyaL (SSP411 family)